MTDDRAHDDEERMLPCERAGWNQPSKWRGGTCTEWRKAVKEEAAAEDCYSEEAVAWVLGDLEESTPPDTITIVDVGDIRSELKSCHYENAPDDRDEPTFEQALCLVHAAAWRLPDDEEEWAGDDD